MEAGADQAQADTGRQLSIDGVRGWAAFSVMCFHAVSILTVPDPTSTSLLYRIFLNGEFDVAVFFVLSGDALSVAYWRTGSVAGVVRLAIKRYPRLTIPIFFSCAIVFILYQFGLTFTHEAAAILRHQDWLGEVLSIRYRLPDLFSFSFADVYFRHTETSSLNPPLWTMSIELLGSILVFVVLLGDRHIRRKTLTLLALTVLLLVCRSYLACFIAGVMFGRWRADGVFSRLRGARYAPGFPAIAAACMVMAASVPLAGTGRVLAFSLLSAAFVFCVLASHQLDWLFSTPLSQWLGRISFPLYLVHFSVLASFSAGMVVWAHQGGILAPHILWLIVVASICLSLLAAIAFEPVEHLTRKIGNALSRYVVDDAEPAGRVSVSSNRAKF